MSYITTSHRLRKVKTFWNAPCPLWEETISLFPNLSFSGWAVLASSSKCLPLLISRVSRSIWFLMWARITGIPVFILKIASLTPLQFRGVGRPNAVATLAYAYQQNSGTYDYMYKIIWHVLITLQWRPLLRWFQWIKGGHACGYKSSIRECSSTLWCDVQLMAISP